MTTPFLGQIRYVKRIDELSKCVSYSEHMQQFNGVSWNDIDPDDAVWESKEKEEDYNLAVIKDKE